MLKLHKHYYKRPFFTTGEEKWKTDPSGNLKILGVAFTKKLKFLKIAGFRAESLDFDFEIQNFFWKQYIILI
jgi:hypothetical protein